MSKLKKTLLFVKQKAKVVKEFKFSENGYKYTVVFIKNKEECDHIVIGSSQEQKKLSEAYKNNKNIFLELPAFQIVSK